MANKHELIVNDIITEWSVQGRGRLFKNHSGGAWMCSRVDEEYFVKDKNGRRMRIVHLFNANFIKYGLRAKNKTLVDIIGFEKINGVPVWCVIEVKTKGYAKITEEQKDCLNMAINFGGRAYVARETEQGYDLCEWECRS